MEEKKINGRKHVHLTCSFSGEKFWKDKSEYTRRLKENPEYKFYKHAKNKAAAAGEKGFKHLKPWSGKVNDNLKKGFKKFAESGGFQDEYSPFRYFIKRAKERKRDNPQRKEFQNFDITLDFLLGLWKGQKGKCALTGVEMQLPKVTQSSRNSPLCASLDRIDPSKGYIKGNVQFVTQLINLGKNTYSQDQVKQFISLIKQ